jgi:hypothetical protein
VASLLVLACPVSMGLMMWMMMRGRHGQGDDTARITQLEQEIADLRGQGATAAEDHHLAVAGR